MGMMDFIGRLYGKLSSGDSNNTLADCTANKLGYPKTTPSTFPWSAETRYEALKTPTDKLDIVINNSAVAYGAKPGISVTSTGDANDDQRVIGAARTCALPGSKVEVKELRSPADAVAGREAKKHLIITPQ